MKAAIEFYFDFSSPYGYFAAEQIEALAARHGRSTQWRPILLGAVFKVTGQQPLVTIPLKGGYAEHDLARSARGYGLPFRKPARFPVATTAACRMFYSLTDTDPAAAKTLAMALYRAYFVDDRDISDPAAVVAVATALGHDGAALSAALEDPALKDRLRQEVDAAVARGVFGSPYLIVDGEPFWGADRLDQMERWLQCPW
jgi:2-hydroxychromene-2-carboxylate isomerase